MATKRIRKAISVGAKAVKGINRTIDYLNQPRLIKRDIAHYKRGRSMRKNHSDGRGVGY